MKKKTKKSEHKTRKQTEEKLLLYLEQLEEINNENTMRNGE
jgi:hypothetical protein